MITPLGQRLIERGVEQGRRQGVEQSLTLVLTRRFGPLLPLVEARLMAVTDPQRLEALLDAALSARSLEEFSRAIEIE